jgi:hypothetical protein
MMAKGYLSCKGTWFMLDVSPRELTHKTGNTPAATISMAGVMY